MDDPQQGKGLSAGTAGPGDNGKVGGGEQPIQVNNAEASTPDSEASVSGRSGVPGVSANGGEAGGDGNGTAPRSRTVRVIAEPGDTTARPGGEEPAAQSQAAQQGRPTSKPEGKVDPLLRQQEVVKGSHPGDKYVRYGRNAGAFQRRGGMLSASLQTEQPRTGWGRIFYRVKRVLIGRPLSTEQSIHERLTNVKALAVLSSDALSSVAYATEEILRILILAGLGALSFGMPLGIAVIILMVIVVASYRQTIAAYPRGGGTYIVAKDNLGTLPGLAAASSILIGYILTVAVSVAAGVAALYSIFPAVRPIRVEICIGLIVFITIANLRGLREAGNIFAVPTYLFILGMIGMIVFGLLKYFTGIGGALHYVAPVDAVQVSTTQAVGILLLLRAFTQGAAALTGVEAIADGVPAFKPPEASNARKTLLYMGVISIVMFGGITYLATQMKVVPSEHETVVSQIARTVFGQNFLWFFIQIVTALILVLAANTAFADFPRLGYFLARDKFMPHQFSFRGDRLAFSWGIVTLAVLACILVTAFNGDTSALIPLYAIGVMGAFTFSQSGMVVRWWRLRPPGWQRNLLMNSIGAATTLMVFLVATFTKLDQGTWLVIAVIPLMMAMFLAINRHYKRVAAEVDALDGVLHPLPYKHTFIVPVSNLNAVTMTALMYARSLNQNVYAVHITEGEDPEEAERFNARWKEALPDTDIQLVIIESPYRSLIGPLLAYIDALDRQSSDDTITIVLPEFLPAKPWEYVLHNQSALRLKASLLFRKNTVVADVPYHLGHRTEADKAIAAFPWVPLGVLVSALLIIYFFVIR